VRAIVARRAGDPERRLQAVAAIGDEDVLVDIALTADHADTRLAAAERVSRPEHLKRLAGVAKSRTAGWRGLRATGSMPSRRGATRRARPMQSWHSSKRSRNDRARS
jgi:hypothetical protein